MSVYNRKMFKPRNARNALNQSAGIPSVQKFQTGGSVLPPRQRVSGAIPTIPGVAGQRMRSYSAPDFSRSMMPRANMAEVARRYIAGEPITASEFSALRGAEQGFLSRKGLSDSMGAFGKSRLGSGIKALLGPAAEIGGQIRGFTEGATSTAAKTLFGSSDGSLPADTIRPPDLSSDYLKSLGIEVKDLTNLQSQSARGGFPPPSAVRPRPVPSTDQIKNPFENDRLNQQRVADEAMAREAMAKDGVVVTNEEAELKASGILPGNPENIAEAQANQMRDQEADRTKEILKDESRRQQSQTNLPDGTDASGDPSETGTTGVVPSTKEEIENVINQGNEADQKSALDGFIKEFMDKAPGYEGLDSGLVLAKIGFAMAAGKSPRAIQNIASALEGGADMLIKDKSKKDEFNRQLKLSALQYGLTETGKLSAQQRLDDRNFIRLAATGDITYEGRTYKKGETIRISTTDLLESDGKLPKGFTDVDVYLDGEKAVRDRLKTNAAATNALRDELLLTDAAATDIQENYAKQAKVYIDSEVGIEFTEKALVTLADDGSITGIKGGIKDLANKLANAGGLDLGAKYQSKAEFEAAVRQSFQKLIPVSLGGVQAANSISNRDVQFLADAYVESAILEGGIFNLASIDEDVLAGKLQSVISEFRRNQAGAASNMRGIEDRLSNRILPGQGEGSGLSLLSESQKRLEPFGVGQRSTLGLVDTGETNAQGLPIFRLPSANV
mgnify:CR=1 FL=1|jgi:hypothetical protein|tara:strand:+ start:417 stop:2603 length:2187 start_codon:yes stop_codon:yes gene_type:complete